MATRKPAQKRSHVRYTPTLGKRICDEISTGRSLIEVCAVAGMPDRHSVRRWVIERADFREQYETAHKWWALAVAEEVNDLADRAQQIAEDAETAGRNGNAAVNALRCTINTKQWLLARLLPAQFGDRISQEITGANGRDLIPAEPDPDKLALALLTVLNSGPGGKNDPATLRALPSMAAMATTTLLSGPSAPAEPLPAQPAVEPVETEAVRREHRRWTALTGPRNWRVIQ